MYLQPPILRGGAFEQVDVLLVRERAPEAAQLIHRVIHDRVEILDGLFRVHREAVQVRFRKVARLVVRREPESHIEPLERGLRVARLLDDLVSRQSARIARELYV